MKKVVIACTSLAMAVFLGFQTGKRHTSVEKDVPPSPSRVANIEDVRQKLELLGKYIAANEEYQQAYLLSVQTGLDATGTVWITMLKPKSANPASSERNPYVFRIGPSGIVEKQQNPQTETTQDGQRRLIIPSQ